MQCIISYQMKGQYKEKGKRIIKYIGLNLEHIDFIQMN